MQCNTCGLLLESVDDSQVERHSKFVPPTIYCEKHKPVEFILA